MTVWQETVTFPLLQCPELLALPSQQGSVSATPKARFRIGTWVAQHTKLCPLSSSQDSTACDNLMRHEGELEKSKALQRKETPYEAGMG